MKKTLFIIAISASFSSAAFAAGSNQIYGKIHVSADSFDQGNNTELKLTSHASRVGIKGNTLLSDYPLTVEYKMEWEVDVADRSGVSTTAHVGDDGKIHAKSKSNFSSRNQYVGIKGGFGSVLFGRHDTPLKISQGKFDLFNDQFGDIKRTLSGELRANNVFAYITPRVGSFTGIVAVVPTEDGSNDVITSAAAMFKMKHLYIGLGYDDYAGNGNVARFTTTFHLGRIRLGALYNQASPDVGNAADGWATNISVKTSAHGKLKFQYQTGEGQTVGKSAKIKNGGNVTSIGYEHKLAKSTSVYAAYHVASFDTPNTPDESVYSVGLVHKFGIKFK